MPPLGKETHKQAMCLSLALHSPPSDAGGDNEAQAAPAPDAAPSGGGRIDGQQLPLASRTREDRAANDMWARTPSTAAAAVSAAVEAFIFMERME